MSQEFSPKLEISKSRVNRIIINGAFVYKQYGNTLLSNILFNRERKNLRYLQRFDFIPRLIGYTSTSLKLQKIEGDFIHHINNPSPNIVAGIKANLDQLHNEWIFHLDLRQRKNYLITRENKAYLIDFESSVRLSKCGILRPIAELLRIIDTSGLLRFKSRYFPSSLTQKEISFLKKYNNLRKLWFFRPFKKRKGDVI
ncbi:MAG: hypothetical protein HY606_12390 [Planctomycetes bacterium]|nr:hypothetical protein [Planctomycetota bacterium]